MMNRFLEGLMLRLLMCGSYVSFVFLFGFLKGYYQHNLHVGSYCFAGINMVQFCTEGLTLMILRCPK